MTGKVAVVTRISDLLELQVPGLNSVNWSARLQDIAHEYCADDIYRRRSRFDLTLFGLGPCARRDAVIWRTRRCFGHDVVTHLNFCRGHLCAVHQFFPSVSTMESQEYYAALEGIRRRLGQSLGPPSLQTRTDSPSQVSFRWHLDGLHAELRSCNGAQKDLSLAVNNPVVCSWCMYWQ
jgi:hypothetical protein